MKQPVRSKKTIIIVAIIAVVAVLAIIISVSNSRQTSEQNDLGSFVKDNGRASLMTDASQASGKQFVFQQLGISIEQPKGLAGLDYTEGPAISQASGRLYVTSDDFKAAAEACGQDPSKSYFASVFIAPSDAYDSSVVATIDGKKIAVGSGNYELSCAGDASTQQARVLSASTKLFKAALKDAQPAAATTQN